MALTKPSPGRTRSSQIDHKSVLMKVTPTILQTFAMDADFCVHVDLPLSEIGEEPTGRIACFQDRLRRYLNAQLALQDCLESIVIGTPKPSSFGISVTSAIASSKESGTIICAHDIPDECGDSPLENLQHPSSSETHPKRSGLSSPPHVLKKPRVRHDTRLCLHQPWFI